MSNESNPRTDRWSASRGHVGELLASTSTAIFAVGHEGQLTLYEGARFPFLTEAGGFVGQAVSDVFGGAPGLVDAARRALAGAHATCTEEAGGRWYECRCTPIPSGEKEPRAAIGWVADVTDRRRAVDARDEQLRLLGQLDVIGWRMDPKTLRLIDVVGATTALRLTRGDSLTQSVHTYERDAMQTLLRAVASDGRARTLIHRATGPEGRTLWFRTHVAGPRAAGGAVPELMGMMQDISERVATESALRDTGSQLRSVLDQLPAIVFTTDSELRFTFGVGAGLAELGLPADAVLTGFSVQEYMHIDDPEHPVLAAFHRALAGENVSFETEWLGYAYQTHVEPFRDARGQTIGTLAVSWNVTARKRAEDAMRLLSEASATLAESLDYAETLGKVAAIMVPRLADWCMVGVLRNDTLGIVASAHVKPEKRALFDALPPTSLEMLGDIGKVVRRGDTLLVAEITDAMIAPGHGVPLPPGALGEQVAGVLRQLGLRSLIVVPLLGRGQTLGALVLARAAADRPYGPSDVRLAEELGHRCALAIDNARLHRASQVAIEMRDEFLSIASHELRTPLTSLLLRLESLERMERARDAPNEDYRAGISGVARQARRMSDLIDELLDVSRMRLGRLKLDRKRLDLAGLVRDVVARLDASANRAGCVISQDTATPVIGLWDPLRVEQVVTNLLSNAIKHAGATTIDIRVESQAKSALLVVRDRGVGITPLDQERIFERFEKGASSRSSGGLGLGLYITRQIVQAHGGTIRVTSRPGEETTFSVELPLEPARALAVS